MANNNLPTPTALTVHSQPVSVFSPDILPEPAQEPTPIPQEVAGESGAGAYGQDIYPAMEALLGTGIETYKAAKGKLDKEAAAEGKAKRWQLQKSYAQAWADGDITSDMNPYFLIAYEEADAEVAKQKFVGAFQTELADRLRSGDKAILEPNGYDNLREEMLGQFVNDYNGSDAANAALMDSPYWGNTFSGGVESWFAKNKAAGDIAIGDARVDRILEAETEFTSSRLYDYAEEVEKIREQHSALALVLPSVFNPAKLQEALAESKRGVQEELLGRIRRLPNVVGPDAARKAILDSSMQAVLNGGVNAPVIMDFVENYMLFGQGNKGDKLVNWQSSEGGVYWDYLKSKYSDRLEIALRESAISFELDAKHASITATKKAFDDKTFPDLYAFIDWTRTEWRQVLDGYGLDDKAKGPMLSAMETRYKALQANNHASTWGTQKRSFTTHLRGAAVAHVVQLKGAGDPISGQDIIDGVMEFAQSKYQGKFQDSKGQTQDIAFRLIDNNYHIIIGDETPILFDTEGIKRDASRTIVEDFRADRESAGHAPRGDLTEWSFAFMGTGEQHPELADALRRVSEENISGEEIVSAREARNAGELGSHPIAGDLMQLSDAAEAVAYLDANNGEVGARGLTEVDSDTILDLRALSFIMQYHAPGLGGVPQDIEALDPVERLNTLYDGYELLQSRKIGLRSAVKNHATYLPLLRQKVYSLLYNIGKAGGIAGVRAEVTEDLTWPRGDKYAYLSTMSVHYPGVEDDLLDDTVSFLFLIGVVTPHTGKDTIPVSQAGMNQTIFNGSAAPFIRKWVDNEFEMVPNSDESFIYKEAFNKKQMERGVEFVSGTAFTLPDTMSMLHGFFSAGGKDTWEQYLQGGVDLNYGGDKFHIAAMTGEDGTVDFRIISPVGLTYGIIPNATAVEILSGQAPAPATTTTTPTATTTTTTPTAAPETDAQFKARVGKGTITQQEYDEMSGWGRGFYRDPSGGTLQPDEYQEWLKGNQ